MEKSGDGSQAGRACLPIKRDGSGRRHHSRLDINVFEGWETPTVETTISRGKVAWDGKKLLTSDGDGKSQGCGFSVEEHQSSKLQFS